MNSIATSYDIRKGLEARGFENVPKSPTTVTKIVVGYAAEERNRLLQKLMTLKQANQFGVSVDEWTSLLNKRYANVHLSDKVFNLGLIRIVGKAYAEKCWQILVKTLEKQWI